MGGGASTAHIRVPLPLGDVRRHVGRTLFVRWGGRGGASRVAFEAAGDGGARAAGPEGGGGGDGGTGGSAKKRRRADSASGDS